MNDIDDEDIFAEEDVKETNVADNDKDLLEFLSSIGNRGADLMHAFRDFLLHHDRVKFDYVFHVTMTLPNWQGNCIFINSSSKVNNQILLGNFQKEKKNERRWKNFGTPPVLQQTISF